MSRLLIKRHVLSNLLDKYIQTTGSGLRGIRIIWLLIVFSIVGLILNNNLYAKDRDQKGISVVLNDNLYANDRDNDGMSDEQEDYIGKNFVPDSIWQDDGEACGPGMYKDDWCLDGDPGAAHQKGFIGYDVIDLKFSGLVAVEIAMFTDRNCTIWSQHDWDVEGFTVLLQKCPSCSLGYRVLSVQTIGHQNSEYETEDRLYPHEVYDLWPKGILMAEGSHATYVHYEACEDRLEAEACDYDKNVRDSFVVGPYDKTACSNYCEDLGSLICLDNYLNIPDCWEKRVMRMGIYEADFLQRYCHVYNYDTVPSIIQGRKQIPPWVPMDIPMPSNLAYVRLFEETSYTAREENLGEDAVKDFGLATVLAGMPLRLFNWPDSAWWVQCYDPAYQLDELKEEDNFGIRRGIFDYIYLTNDEFHGSLEFSDNIKSFILNGLPGTNLLLCDFKPLYYGPGVLYGWERVNTFVYVIPDGCREVRVSDLGDMNKKFDFVTWGFGPLADAGNDTTVKCREKVILDGRKSYEYALDPKMAFQVFNLGQLDYDSVFSYDSIWTYEWFDESDGNRLLGTGALFETNSLEVGTHSIKLRVSGITVPDPFQTDSTMAMQVCDWCTVTVTIGDPVGIISGIVADSISGIKGVTVTAFNLDSNSATNPANFRVACTDENGFYYFDSLAPGDFRVNIVTPLGFVSEQDTKYDSIAYSCWPPPVTINFQVVPLSITPSQRSMGFWKHQVNAHLEGKGKHQVSLTELSSYMNLISVHFNHNCANPVSIFQVPQPATQSDSLRALQKLLTVNKDGTMNDRAKQQLIALLLNMVSLKLHQRTQISMDSANVSQAITYCSQLITDSDPKNDEIAKDIADYINNSMVVVAGVIPLTTPNIMYKAEGQIAEAKVIPEEFSLSHNYPNPFNPETQIDYSLPKDCNVKLIIFNVLGQKIKILVDEFQTAGFKMVHWDGKDDKGQVCASGIYFYRLEAGEFSQAKKMVIVK